MRLEQVRQLFHVLIERAAALRVRLQLLQGSLPAAVHWAAGSGLSPDDKISFPHEVAYLTLARVRVAPGQAEDVGPLPNPLLSSIHNSYVSGSR